jgi:predicted DNA-binding transcriptional regulator AlpA
MNDVDPRMVILRYKDLKKAGHGSRVSIWRRVREGKFPAPRKLPGGGVGFLLLDVIEHVKSLPRANSDM